MFKLFFVLRAGGASIPHYASESKHYKYLTPAIPSSSPPAPFFSTVPPLSLSLQKHICSAVLKIQAVRLHWNRGSFFSRHQGFTLPQQMASLSEISQVRYFSISLFIVFPPSLFLRFIFSLFSFRILGTTLSSR